MRASWLLFGLGLIALSGCADRGVRMRAREPVHDAELQTELATILKQQDEAWNRGDLNGFMETYWKSNELTFCGGGKTTHGWQATLDRYRSRYPDRATMGTLSFSEMECWRLDTNAALVLGRFKLERANDAPSGNFSLVMRKIGGAWKIVHDHSSLDAKQ